MPRPVVPIARPCAASSRALSSARVPVEDHVRAARDAHPRRVAQHAAPLRARRARPADRPDRRRPRARSGSRCPGRARPPAPRAAPSCSPSTTSVWPALLPPWKRTTSCACGASQSTILPLPSSPHWAPTATSVVTSRAPRAARRSCAGGSAAARARTSSGALSMLTSMAASPRSRHQPELHARDVDAGLAEHRADRAHDPGRGRGCG